MNLNNLKTTVPTKFYKRSKDYLEQGFVEQLTEDAPNRFHAIVEARGITRCRLI
ncbi:hypothetical protein [Planococcus sp. CAU13]|uniref:hypothetical protein n=1 Tax=Planococcus sp. CAU13 TaxID=1541197 RepID=UPI000ACD92A7|nr:hypothetical protein [Planococcus sp. CAU13]